MLPLCRLPLSYPHAKPPEGTGPFFFGFVTLLTALPVLNAQY